MNFNFDYIRARVFTGNNNRYYYIPYTIRSSIYSSLWFRFENAGIPFSTDGCIQRYRDRLYKSTYQFLYLYDVVLHNIIFEL